MKRRLAIALAVIAAALALGLVALVVAVRFVDVDSFRPMVQDRLKKATGRDVTFGRIGLTALPLPTLVVEDLVVASPAAGAEPWVEAKALRARVQLMPLFSGRVEVVSLAVDEPVVRVLRAPDGRVNLLSLIGEPSRTEEPARVTLQSIAVRGGRVLVQDAFVHPGAVERLELEGLDARVPDLASRPLDVSARGQVAGGRGAFDVTASIGPSSDFSGRLASEGLDLLALSPWLEGLTGMSGVAGRLTCELEGQRAGQAMSARGQLAVKGLALPVAQKGAPPLDAALVVDVAVDERGATTIRRLDLATGDTKVALAGSVAMEDRQQVLTLRLAKTRLRPKDLAPAAAAFGFELPGGALAGEEIGVEGAVQVTRAGDPRRVERIVLDGLKVSGARVVLTRDASGRWLLPGAEAEAASAPRAAAGAAGPALSARDLALSGASVTIDDRMPGGFGRIEAAGVSVKLASYAAGQPGPFEMSAEVAGGRLAIKGQLAQAGATSLDVTASGVRLADLAPLMAASVGGSPRAGTLDWQARVRGTLGQSLNLAGQATLHDARLPLPDGREVTLNLPVEHDVTIEAGGRVRGKRLVLGLPGGALPLAFEMQPGRFVIATDGATRLSPESVSWLVALAGDTLPFGFTTDDPLTLDARIARLDGGLQVAGNIAVTRARLTHRLLPAPLEVARAQANMEGDRIDISDAALRLGASTLTGALSVRDLSAPRLEFDLVAPVADLDELFAMTGRATEPSSGSSAPETSLATRLRANGRLRVDRATFAGLEMTRFDSNVRLDGGRLAFDPATLVLYGGSARSTVLLDLSSDVVGFDMKARFEGIDAGALARAGLGYQDLDGTGDVTLDLTGRAGSVASAIATLAGSADMTLRDGAFRGLNALEPLKRAGVFGERSLATLAGRIAREGTPFSTLDARTTLGGGVLTITALDMRAPDADITGKGRARLQEQQLDMDLVIDFSQALSEQMRAEGSRAAELFWNASKGRVSLPARLTGPLGSPSAQIDFGAAASQAVRTRVTDALSEALGLGRGRPGGSASGPSGPSGPSGASGAVGESRPAVGEAPLSPGAGASAPPPAAPAPAPGALVATLDSARFGGPVLAPDLRLRATLSGLDLARGEVLVTDEAGKTLVSVTDAFAAAVTAHYATAPRDQPARIAVKLDVDGKRLLGAKKVKVSVVAVDAAGQRSAPATATVERGGLF